MRNMAVLHSPAFSYPLPVLVRVLFNLLIFKGKILYYNKYSEKVACLLVFCMKNSFHLEVVPKRNTFFHLVFLFLQETNRTANENSPYSRLASGPDFL